MGDAATVLCPLPFAPVSGPMPRLACELVQEGLRRAKAVDCFDFVPSNYSVVYAVLSAMPLGRLCEWGSGAGIVTGLAEMLGFAARGIEVDPRLADVSRGLLADFGLSATIHTGDYFESRCDADLYFTYCWPGQMERVQRHFESVAADHARLLICHGAEDIRCKVKSGRSPLEAEPP